MAQEPIESYLRKRRPSGDGYEPLTTDFAAQHPDDDYPPAWTYGPWWADFAFCAYLFVRTVLVFVFYQDDVINATVARALWTLFLVVAVIVAIVRFRERRRWRLSKDMRS